MSELISFLMSYISNPWIIVAILGFLPLTEVRIAVLYGIIAGLNHFNLFLVAASANILEAAVIFLIIGNKRVLNLMNRIIGKKIEENITKNKEKLEKYGMLAPIFLVATPLPGTGTIISVMAAKMLKLDKKWSFVAVCAGISISAAIVLLAANFFIALFGNNFI